MLNLISITVNLSSFINHVSFAVAHRNCFKYLSKIKLNIQVRYAVLSKIFWQNSFQFCWFLPSYNSLYNILNVRLNYETWEIINYKLNLLLSQKLVHFVSKIFKVIFCCELGIRIYVSMNIYPDIFNLFLLISINFKNQNRNKL